MTNPDIPAPALPIAAIESACKFMEEHVAPRRCDSDGVSHCWRCASVALARWMRQAIPILKASNEPANPDITAYMASLAAENASLRADKAALVDALMLIKRRAFSDAPAEELEDVQRDLRHIHAAASKALSGAKP
jgi:hypothetical protein